MTTKPLLPPESASAVASSDSEITIPFAFGGKDDVATTVNTPSLHYPYSPGVISLSSSSSLYSTGVVTDEETEDLGAER